MEAVLECCVGLDVHQETVVACVIFGPLEHMLGSEKAFRDSSSGVLFSSHRDWYFPQFVEYLI